MAQEAFDARGYPIVRVPAGSSLRPSIMADGFQNFEARVGIGTNNQSSSSTYGPNYITRNRIMLELAYRGSWVVGAAVDYPADDMTQGGIDIKGVADGKRTDQLYDAIDDLELSQNMASTIKWARLFGGCIGVLMIEGQNTATALNPDSIQRDQFRGILPLDRTMVNPGTIAPDGIDRKMGPNFGLPLFYDVMAQPVTGVPAMRVHASRVIRMSGIAMPYYQRWAENLWGISVIERLFDRLVAFDSTTQGAAQLVFKAHLRTYSIPKLRQIIAAGGDMMNALLAQLEMVRRFQTNEGLTLLQGGDDASADKMQAMSYTFAGLDKILEAFGDQLCGALEIPRTRLFGQSPGGLNSTGDSDLTTYEDGIRKKQNTYLRRPWVKVLDILHRSALGGPPPPGFGLQFRPLRPLSDSEKADNTVKITGAVVSAFEKGIVDRGLALRELRASSAETGVWAEIQDEDIADADSEPDLSEMTQTPEEAAQMVTEGAVAVQQAKGGGEPGAVTE